MHLDDGVGGSNNYPVQVVPPLRVVPPFPATYPQNLVDHHHYQTCCADAELRVTHGRFEMIQL